MRNGCLLTLFYEGNGLFAKIIDAPAEEAVKHGRLPLVRNGSLGS